MDEVNATRTSTPKAEFMRRMELENGTETRHDVRIMRFERANNASEQFGLGEADDLCVTFTSTGTDMGARRERLSSTTKDGVFTAAWRE